MVNLEVSSLGSILPKMGSSTSAPGRTEGLPLPSPDEKLERKLKALKRGDLFSPPGEENRLNLPNKFEASLNFFRK
ncbi:hypothetical protein HWI79_3278 [Cryptosporidium felis]|nr:hypothetical protein HWI79_3278 [Cryptosporidium felis]